MLLRTVVKTPPPPVVTRMSLQCPSCGDGNRRLLLSLHVKLSTILRRPRRETLHYSKLVLCPFLFLFRFVVRRFQDFLYRRAVASCCRALWCCCLCPCLPGLLNDNDTDIARFGEDELPIKYSARVSAAEQMEDGVGASSMRTTSSTAPANGTPARSTPDVVPLSTPSAPREAFSIAPMRPARPCRKTHGNPCSTGDSAMSMESRGNSGGSARRMEDKKESNVSPREEDQEETRRGGGVLILRAIFVDHRHVHPCKGLDGEGGVCRFFADPGYFSQGWKYQPLVITLRLPGQPGNFAKL